MSYARELVIDSFAGGGGASLGIEKATGRPVDVAINHDREAVTMHAANHPRTKHYQQDIWQVSPEAVAEGRPVGLAWFSPDCKHFSKAKGGKPVEKGIRDLAWVVVEWAKTVRPRIIMLENVEEFRTWGPLDDANMPIKARKGETFGEWCDQLRALGYVIEWRELRACDYGAPTIRKRLFVIARCDGEPIVWPVPTYGKGLRPYRTAAECIDWRIACPSIFERKRPLAEATLRRIAAGIRRFVIESPTPYIVRTAFKEGNGSYIHGLDEPFRTLTAQADHAVVAPFVAPLTHQGGDRVESLEDPAATVTGAHRGEKALITPFLAGVGGRAGQSPERSVEDPMRTKTSKADEVLVAPVIVRNNHDGQGKPADSVDEPLRAVTTQHNKFELVAGTLVQTGYGEREGQEPRALDPEKPLGTVVGGGAKHAAVGAFLAKHYGGVVGSDVQAPIGTVTSWDHHSLVSSNLVELHGTSADGQPVDQPLATISAGGLHHGEVRAFLEAYYGNDKNGQAIQEPLRTVTSKERFGLVYVEGIAYEIVDIGMRMLEPKELFAAQGFPPSYIIAPIINGKPLSKTAQIRMCGNSVCPQMSEALVRANYTPNSQVELWQSHELVAAGE